MGDSKQAIRDIALTAEHNATVEACAQIADDADHDCDECNGCGTMIARQIRALLVEETGT